MGAQPKLQRSAVCLRRAANWEHRIRTLSMRSRSWAKWPPFGNPKRKWKQGKTDQSVALSCVESMDYVLPELQEWSHKWARLRSVAKPASSILGLKSPSAYCKYAFGAFQACSLAGRPSRSPPFTKPLLNSGIKSPQWIQWTRFCNYQHILKIRL